MAETTDNLLLEHLRAIRVELIELRGQWEKTDRKVGDLGQGMVSLKHQLNALTRDMQMFGVATEAHTQRLDRIEARLGLPPDA